MGDNDQQQPDPEAAAPAAMPAVGGAPSDDAQPMQNNVDGGTPINFACVYKGNEHRPPTGWDTFAKLAICSRIRTLLRQCTGNGRTLAPTVSWVFSPDEISGPDIVVYFLDNPGQSIIKAKYPRHYQEATGGLTILGVPEIVSEVYIEGSFPVKRISHAAFHEMMHAKLNLGNPMHNRVDDPRGQGLGGGAMATIPANENDELNDANKAALDRTILNPINWYKGEMKKDA